MPVITVHQKGEIQKISVEAGETLLRVLRNNHLEVYSPCGGNGTCGKCEVFVKGEGIVTSCLYPVKEDIEVVLPDQREAKILVDQHILTLKLPLNPGISADLSYYPHGVAIDIGTTTLVLYLVNLMTGGIIETRAVINPQVKFGADVISRINYSAHSPDGLKTLQNEIITAINLQLDHFAEILGVPHENIVKITIAGNTTMLHLLLGVDPLSIALAPFIPVFIDEQHPRAAELGFHSHADAEIKVLPSISAYVGADIVAGIASIKPQTEYKRYLFMDIGTNGEMAIVTPEKIWCCATAAGPAFEGANISCGMSAVEGAINFYCDGIYRTIGDSAPQGICGSGLIDITAHLVRNKIITEDGFLDKDFIIADDSPDFKEVVLTQQDVREVQLAKSAIRAGINVLMNKASLSFSEIDVLFLAGGFGNYIDTKNAIEIGMLPKELENKIISIGNSSGTGALLALKSVSFDSVVDQVRKKTEYIELSDHDDFTLDFVMNMGFAN